MTIGEELCAFGKIGKELICGGCYVSHRGRRLHVELWKNGQLCYSDMETGEIHVLQNVDGSPEYLSDWAQSC